MPVDLKRYPADWPIISEYVRFFRAGGRCEGSPDYPNCQARHGKPHPVTGSRVILTTAHLGTPWPDGTPGDKHNKMDVRLDNLAAMCQRCHLNFDLDEHIANAVRTRKNKQLNAGQLEMNLHKA